jgi:Caudovirus prohead serine protease
VWLELREDFRGLYACGRLIPEVMRGRELLALLRAGAIDGLSIGFRTVKGRVDPKSRIRKLDQLELWEISIVTFPLLAGARVRAVKAAAARVREAQNGRALHIVTDSSAVRGEAERLFRRHPRFSFACPARRDEMAGDCVAKRDRGAFGTAFWSRRDAAQITAPPYAAAGKAEAFPSRASRGNASGGSWAQTGRKNATLSHPGRRKP